MKTNHPACNPERLERFLDDALNEQEAAALENHLESCAACRRELEARAADEGLWSQARDCLAESDLSHSGCDANQAPIAHDATKSWEGGSAADAGEIHASLAAVKPYLTPTDDPRMLGRVGPYEIMGIVGSGGNGIVLKGFDVALNRYVAVKLLSPRLADSGAARRRFSREAQAAAAVVHDNVMAIHAVAQTRELPYLVMPYVRGPSLESRIRSNGPLAVEEVLRVGMQVAAGLAAAHAQGLVHRDIKPANVLLEEGVERVKITDFGLARAADDASLTRSGVIAGTPQYMSPEQARGEPVDHRTDLFSLGCLLYAACTGRAPFRADTSYGVLRKICESQPRAIRELNPAAPAWLAKLIDRLLAKEPSKRYDSAAHVAVLLEQCLAHAQQPATVKLPEELLEPTRSRKRVRRITAAGVALLVPLMVFIAWRWWPVGDVDDRASPAAFAPRESVASQTSATTADWNDDIGERIKSLTADIDQLQVHGADNLWNDSLAARIERLRGDTESFAAEVGAANGDSNEASKHRPEDW